MNVCAVRWWWSLPRKLLRWLDSPHTPHTLHSTVPFAWQCERSTTTKRFSSHRNAKHSHRRPNDRAGSVESIVNRTVDTSNNNNNGTLAHSVPRTTQCYAYEGNPTTQKIKQAKTVSIPDRPTTQSIEPRPYSRTFMRWYGLVCAVYGVCCCWYDVP